MSVYRSADDVTAATSGPQPAGYIPSLDGIRAVAFLIVFFSHVPGVPGIFPGGFGVTIFFFLSGYLIATLLRREVVAHQRIDFRGFYLRRALRILPPMYMTLVGASALAFVGWIKAPPNWSSILWQLGFLTNYYVTVWQGQVIEGTRVMWSLAVEEHFYLVYPFLAMFLLRVRAPGFAGLLLVVLAWRIAMYALGGDSYRLAYGTDTRIDSILFGVFMANHVNPLFGQTPAWLQGRRLVVVLVLSLVALLASVAARADWFRDTVRYSVQGVALLPVFFAAVSHPRWFCFRWLNWRWLRFFGGLTYMLYLIHHLVIAVVWDRWRDWPTMMIVVITLLGSVALALLSHLLVERPLARLRRRLHQSASPAKI